MQFQAYIAERIDFVVRYVLGSSECSSFLPSNTEPLKQNNIYSHVSGISAASQPTSEIFLLVDILYVANLEFLHCNFYFDRSGKYLFHSLGSEYQLHTWSLLITAREFTEVEFSNTKKKQFLIIQELFDYKRIVRYSVFTNFFRPLTAKGGSVK